MNESEKDIHHRRQTETRLSTEGRKYFRYIEFDADEELVTEIRKHPVGLAIIILTGGFVMLALAIVGIFASVTDFVGITGAQETSQVGALITIVCILLIIGAAVMTFIAAFLYNSNVIFVTSEKIAQVVYKSLFNRKISQLSIGDVQDTTVTQKGVIAHMFNYGTLVIETAGEQQNYTFTYVPDPYQVSKMIVGSHERNLKDFGN